MHTPSSASKPSAGAAFTLIELLVVIVVIAILAGITLGVSGWVSYRARQAKGNIEKEKIKAALEEYRALYGEYPIVGNPNHYPANWEPDLETSSNLPMRFRILDLVGAGGETGTVHACPGAVETLPFSVVSAGESGLKADASAITVRHTLTWPLYHKPIAEGRPPFIEFEKVTVCYVTWRNVADDAGYVGTNRYYIGEDQQNYIERLFLKGDPVNRVVAIDPLTRKQWLYSCANGTSYNLQ